MGFYQSALRQAQDGAASCQRGNRRKLGMGILSIARKYTWEIVSRHKARLGLGIRYPVSVGSREKISLHNKG